MILSVTYFTYIIAYTFRLLIGAIKFSKTLTKIHTTKELEQARKASNLSLLFHLQESRKNHPLHAAYLPLLLLRNEIIALLMVTLSFNPIYQIAGSGAIFLAFTLYSLRFCPYQLLIRIFLHIS
jgi:hypothetical protein